MFRNITTTMITFITYIVYTGYNIDTIPQNYILHFMKIICHKCCQQFY